MLCINVAPLESLEGKTGSVDRSVLSMNKLLTTHVLREVGVIGLLSHMNSGVPFHHDNC